MRSRAALALAPVGLLVVGTAAVRCRGARWGATAPEATGPLVGDDLVREPHLSSTRGITVRAPLEEVFPWLAQLGQGRGGFYSYDWLENSTGLGIHSADRIMPEHQHLEPGDRVPVAPGPPFYGFLVAEVASPTHLVLQMRLHPFTGAAIPPGATPSGWAIDATWAFRLRAVDDATTRLVSRTRVHLRLPPGLRHAYAAGLDVVEFVMERRMLLGIRERAERRPGPAPTPSMRG